MITFNIITIMHVNQVNERLNNLILYKQHVTNDHRYSLYIIQSHVNFNMKLHLKNVFKNN